MATQTIDMVKKGTGKRIQEKQDLITLKPSQTNTETARAPSTIKESSMTRKWVHNLSKTPLTEDQ